MKKNNDCCPPRNQEIPSGKAQYQALQDLPESGDLAIIPEGNVVNLCGIVKTCETLTQISQFRLASDTLLEIVYIGEDLIPVSKTVDLSGLAGSGSSIDIDVFDTDTISLTLNVSNELTANLKVDATSTAPITSSPDGLKIDCCPETPLVATSSDTLSLSGTGDVGHSLSGAVIFDDTSTVTLASSGSGLVAAVKLSNDPTQLIKIDGTGLLVSETDVQALITDAQAVDVDAPLVYDSLTNTISIPIADAVNDGYLSFGDWNTFNDKVSQSRSILTTAPLSGGGDLSADRTISMTPVTPSQDGYLLSSDFNIFAGKVSPTRTINTTSPLLGGGTLAGDLTLSIQAASTTQSGFLSQANFITFNNKVDTAVNVGTGAGVFKQKNGTNLELRTLTGTSGQIVISQNADTVNIGIDPDFSSGGGGGTDLIIKDEGSNITTAAVSINFAGAGVTATQSAGDVTVTIPGQTFAIANTSYVDGTYTANIADADKVVFLKATTANLVYNVSPATFSGRKIILYCNQTGAFTVTINASSGTLGLATSYVAVDHECLTIYSDGTNLFTIAKN